MEIVIRKPAKPTKQKKYKHTCKKCWRDPKGVNYNSTTFIANFPEDYNEGIFGYYCYCPECSSIHYVTLRARLQYLLYEFKKRQQSS